MADNEKAYVWSCADFSDGEQKMSKLAARFQSVDIAKSFKEAFEAGKAFNVKAKDGAKDEDLTWADTVEDIDEPREDDIDTNKTADKDGED